MKKNKIYIKSYGCQMNVYDSNRILDLFKNQNYEIADDPEDANLVVLNTCHIREKAAEKMYSDIGPIILNWQTYRGLSRRAKKLAISMASMNYQGRIVFGGSASGVGAT